MKLYHIKDSYISFLKKLDSKVSNNKEETRPYIGVVLEINGIKYYAPLSSPKPKHNKMKNAKDFRKISGGKYGAINFNNMIPVPEEALIDFDISKEEDVKYRRLLQNQYQAISKDEKAIISTATKLRKILISEDTTVTDADKRIKDRCCNIKVLEKKYKEYKS